MLFSDLSDNQLADRQLTTAKLTTYEYIFFLMAKWSAVRRDQTPKEFSFSNDLGTSKLLLYPFFFATANGHSRDLFELMGPFFAKQDGPMPKLLLEEAFNPEAPFKFFRLDFQQENQFGISINSVDIYSSWEQLEYDILNTQIGNISFEDLCVQADEHDPFLPKKKTPVHRALMSSLSNIQQTNFRFIELSSTGLARLCSYYRSFKYYLEKEPDHPISFEYVQKDRKVIA